MIKAITVSNGTLVSFMSTYLKLQEPYVVLLLSFKIKLIFNFVFEPTS